MSETSRPFYKNKFIGRYQDLADEYSVSTLQIIHDCFEVKLLGTDVVYHILIMCYRLFICLCIFLTSTV